MRRTSQRHHGESQLEMHDAAAQRPQANDSSLPRPPPTETSSSTELATTGDWGRVTAVVGSRGLTPLHSAPIPHSHATGCRSSRHGLRKCATMLVGSTETISWTHTACHATLPTPASRHASHGHLIGRNASVRTAAHRDERSEMVFAAIHVYDFITPRTPPRIQITRDTTHMTVATHAVVTGITYRSTSRCQCVSNQVSHR